MYVEKDKHLLTLFRIAPERAFREMFDVYYMQLCVYVVQLTDSFDMAEDVVQEFMVYFLEKKYYEKVSDNLRGYLFYAVSRALKKLRKDNNLMNFF